MVSTKSMRGDDASQTLIVPLLCPVIYTLLIVTDPSVSVEIFSIAGHLIVEGKNCFDDL
jgi:hypothetical protein